MAIALSNLNSYDDVLYRMEKMISNKYQDRIKELEEKNRYMERMHMQMPMAKVQPGDILMCNPNTYSATSVGGVQSSTPNKKKDIKSLIAYYYKR